eukprot:15227-Heterococcus_DN1.PRE.1
MQSFMSDQHQHTVVHSLNRPVRLYTCAPSCLHEQCDARRSRYYKTANCAWSFLAILHAVY